MRHFKRGLLSLGFIIAMTSLACSKLSPSNGDDLARLPDKMNSASVDPGINAQSSTVITIAKDATTYMGKDRVSRDRLTDMIKQNFINRPEEEKIVYLKADASVSFSSMVDVLKAIRLADIDRVALVVRPANSADNLFRLEIRLPASAIVDQTSDNKVRVQPMTSSPYLLNVSVRADRTLRLNNEDEGTLDNTNTLRARIAEVIRQRDELGSTLPEAKTVIIYAARVLPYSEVAKVIDAVAGAGARPIGVQLDDEAPRPTPTVQPLRPELIEGGIPIATPK